MFIITRLHIMVIYFTFSKRRDRISYIYLINIFSTTRINYVLIKKDLNLKKHTHTHFTQQNYLTIRIKYNYSTRNEKRIHS